jgi:hypothetical protein
MIDTPPNKVFGRRNSLCVGQASIINTDLVVGDSTACRGQR